MSKFLFLFFFFIAWYHISYSQKQGTIKYYIYERMVSGGAMAVDENGRPRSKPEKEYFIYIEGPKGNSPIITTAYINGLSYSGKANKVKSPVVISELGSPGGKKTLVKKTVNQLWQVLVTEDDTILKPTPELNKMIKENEFVLKGFLKGKSFISTTKKIKKLQPLMAE